MGKIWLKIKSHPLLTKWKLTLTSPHLLIILRSTPPHPLLPPRIGSLIPSLRVGCLPQAQKVLQMILQRMSSLHWNHLTLYRLSTRVADNSFSKISHTSAYLEITSLQVHFQLVVRKRFHIFFILPRNIRRKSGPFSYFFFRLCIQELKVLYITFTCSLVHVELGPELLQRPFFRGGQFSLVEQFLFLDTEEKFISLLCKACNQFVYIYIDQFIAIQVNSWVFHSL